MQQALKRSFIGYELDSAEKEIEEINKNYDIKRRELEKAIAEQKDQREMDNSEMTKIKAKIEDKAKMRDMIKNELYDSYMQAIEKIVATMDNVEGSIKDLKTLLEVRQTELTRYQNYIKTIKTEVLSVASRYKTILEEEAVDKWN
ncbi:MAG: hypothetical protein WCR27_10005 [Eubacteriales bacterium]